MTLERRTPLRRGKPLKRSATLGRGQPLQRGAGIGRSTRLNPMSRKRLAATEAREEVRQQVYARDRRCLLSDVAAAGRCMGRRTPHHIQKAGQGGPYDTLNLVQLCAHHNDWIETAPGQPLALLWGLWCRQGDTLERCWLRLFAYGLVTYDSTGAPACP